MRTHPAVLAMVLFLFLTGSAAGQKTESNHLPVTVQVPRVILADVDRAELIFCEEDFVSEELAAISDLGITVTKPSAITIQVLGNVGYTVLVSTDNAPAFVSQSTGVTLPVSQLEWRFSPDPGERERNNWQSLRPNDVIMFAHPQGGKISIELDFRLSVLWENPATTYEGEILYTVVPEI